MPLLYKKNKKKYLESKYNHFVSHYSHDYTIISIKYKN